MHAYREAIFWPSALEAYVWTKRKLARTASLTMGSDHVSRFSWCEANSSADWTLTSSHLPRRDMAASRASSMSSPGKRMSLGGSKRPERDDEGDAAAAPEPEPAAAPSAARFRVPAAGPGPPDPPDPAAASSKFVKAFTRCACSSIFRRCARRDVSRSNRTSCLMLIGARTASASAAVPAPAPALAAPPPAMLK